MGIAIDKVFVSGVTEPALPYFEEYKPAGGWDPRAEAVTIEHLLSMTSGYACDDLRGEYACELEMQKADDYLRFALELPMAHDPGAHWAYNIASLWMLGEIIAKTLGMKPEDFADTYLFAPLGVEKFQWFFSPQGRPWLAGGPNTLMTPQNMAKFGLMVLGGGVWGKERVVSERWVEESTRSHATTQFGGGYGYLWWVGDIRVAETTVPGYLASGVGGQQIFVFPTLDMVCVFTAGNFGINNRQAGQAIGILRNSILPAALPSWSPPTPVDLSPDLLAIYAGTYELEGRPVDTIGAEDVIMGVVLEDGRLLARDKPDDPPVELIPSGEDAFTAADEISGDIPVRFFRDGSGRVAGVRVDSGFDTPTFTFRKRRLCSRISVIALRRRSWCPKGRR
jgi:hypothetical protein